MLSGRGGSGINRADTPSFIPGVCSLSGILYGFKDAPKIFKYCSVFKSDRIYSFLFRQECRTSLIIIRTGIMNFSIQLNCQFDFRVIEIYNRGPDALLHLNFKPFNCLSFNIRPKKASAIAEWFRKDFLYSSLFIKSA